MQPDSGKMTPCNNGFTVLELSIVLLIIALVVGGIFVGTALIRSAKIVRTIDQISMLNDAVTQFQDKYKALPGDLNNATSFWGTHASCPNLPSIRQTATCNGDGSGYIDTSNESFYFWQHLGDAAMINGKYSGAATAGTPYAGIDCPAAPVGGCWTLGYIPPNRPGSWQLWADHITETKVPAHIFSLGHNIYSHSYEEPYPTLTENEVFEIDTKIDDGMPATGKITTRPGYCLPIAGEPCFSPSPCITAVAITATYNPANKDILCNLDYTTDF